MNTEQSSGARPLRVGVDARKLLDDRRGIGRYVRALLRSWVARARDRIDLTLLVPDLFPRLIAGRLIAEAGVTLPVARAGATGYDLLWHPWNGMTWVATSCIIATVHDCWPFASPADSVAIRRNEQAPFLKTAANARFIIADSVFGRSEIVRHLGVEASKIEVIPLGVASAESSPALLSVDRDYILFVGQAEKRKALAALLDAMQLLPDAFRARYRLIVAGKGQPGPECRVPSNARVEFTGEVDDGTLAQLYDGAAAFVFPSTYEGFGLPVLEAMSHGVPVVASDAASVPEAGGDAALYFPAGDVAALATAIRMMLEDQPLADRLRAAGRARAAAMTWDRCADATLAFFERVSASVRSR
jgi:glycosyltransferase involved in cell wall biosynthesis